MKRKNLISFFSTETSESLDNLDAIASVNGVDVLFVGPNDLSIALGVPGQFSSPLLLSAIERVIQTANRHGKAAGIQCGNAEGAAEWRRKGMRFLSVSSEMGLLMKASKEAVEGMKRE